MINIDNIRQFDFIEFEKHCQGVPYYIMPRALYTPEMLFDKYDLNRPEESFKECYDTRVYKHVVATGKVATEEYEIGSRALHDASIRRVLMEHYKQVDRDRIVGIMGGHQLARGDSYYRQVVDIAKRLTESGHIMISGGGPGAMEATHVGAWMAGRSKKEVDEAIAILAEAPTYQDKGWFAQAYRARERFPLTTGYKSLAIPTFFYGHEPPTIFATHIAKFFDNSQREDLILTAAFGGLIFMPGSAGTLQEVFQEIVQDHYLVYGESSPMVFVGKEFWTKEVPVVPFIKHMTKNGRYKNLSVSVYDRTSEVVKAITSNKTTKQTK
ncbi:MAG: LOG family protein [Bacteroidales bacterium]|nr:LOG family protein [Bacteroidales bacterium]